MEPSQDLQEAIAELTVESATHNIQTRLAELESEIQATIRLLVALCTTKGVLTERLRAANIMVSGLPHHGQITHDNPETTAALRSLHFVNGLEDKKHDDIRHQGC